jgi:predicted lipoprotein with Yx(FWY)xxD motif
VRLSTWRSPAALRLLALVVFTALVVLFVVFRPSPTPGSGVEVLATKAYGSVLAVKGGPLAGFPLYEFSGDANGHLGCGHVKARGYDLDPNGALTMTCTGPMNDVLNNVISDDWPAFTTKKPPIAGAGVNQSLIGTIDRPGIGEQVTYAGHPLYLFDPSSAPFKPLGENYLESVAPLAPWHGYWTLVSASNGVPDTGAATVEVGTESSGEHVVAVEDDPNVNPIAVTVYTYSGGLCTGTCDPEWIPVLTTTTPLVRGLNVHDVGDVRLANGSLQVTYDAKPLYEYSREKVSLAHNGDLAAAGTAGNGNGLHGRSGTFSVVPVSP